MPDTMTNSTKAMSRFQVPFRTHTTSEVWELYHYVPVLDFAQTGSAIGGTKWTPPALCYQLKPQLEARHLIGSICAAYTCRFGGAHKTSTMRLQLLSKTSRARNLDPPIHRLGNNAIRQYDNTTRDVKFSTTRVPVSETTRATCFIAENR